MCEYFILSKPKQIDVNNDSLNQIITLCENVYILPKTNFQYYAEHGLFEKGLIEWSKQFCSKDKIMLDIGAHSGTYSITLSEYNKKIYSFEPQRMTYYSLCGSVALSNITNVNCINVGLGSEQQVGKQRLNIVSLDGGGSSLHSTPTIATEEINVRTLDSFELNDIGFIKMDVEENELQVLEGSIKTLERSNYPKILFEMNHYNESLVQFLKQLNYNIVHISVQNMFLAVH